MNNFLHLVINYTLIGLEIYQYLLLLYTVASWFGGLPRNSLGDFVRDLVEPLLKKVQIIPHRIGPIDLSVLYAFILIGFIKMLVSAI